MTAHLVVEGDLQSIASLPQLLRAKFGVVGCDFTGSGDRGVVRVTVTLDTAAAIERWLNDRAANGLALSFIGVERLRG